MTSDQMRDSIAKAYSGEGWKKKVNKMNDHQVMAVYYNFLGKGKVK